jgi:hypothetical protein
MKSSNPWKIVAAITVALAALSACRTTPTVARPAAPVDLAESARDGIPADVAARVDGVFPGWCLHRVSPEALAFLKKSSPKDNPVLVNGDFDGDGRQDIGFLMDQGGHTKLIVAHKLKGVEGHRVFFFEEDSADYLQMKRKGTGGFDHNTGKGFTFPADSVEANAFEKFAHAYIFSDGKYHMAQTSD